MRISRVLAVAAALAAVAPAAWAEDQLRAGKSVGSLWAFLAPDVGMEHGIFARYGIVLDTADLGNGPKLFQALTADSIDIGLSAGSDMAFAVKGVPAKAVAAFAEEPRSVVLMVAADSPIETVADLKGKLIGMPGVGSVSEWLVRRMALAEGWGEDGVKTVAQGSAEANLAALRTQQIDAMVGPIELGFNLEDRHEGRVVVKLAHYAPHFHAHVVFATDKIIAAKPGVLERFLKGFFASIAFIKANKAATTATAMRVLHESKEIADKTYDYEVSMLLPDGSFDPQAIDVLRDSWVELGMLEKKPEADQFMTTRFVPVTP